MSALDQLLSLTEASDPFRNPPENLRELQLEAARERFRERRGQIKVLDQRARDRGVDEPSSFQELVPLLFSDATYKSYPESFVENGKWRHLTLWLQTLSTQAMPDMDFSRVNDMDEWIEELRRNGQHVVSSSGTSGKNSFIPRSIKDREMQPRLMTQGLRWAVTAFRENFGKKYPMFLLMPKMGSYTATDQVTLFAQQHGIPGDIHFISNMPQSAVEMSEMMRLNRALAAGTAKPSEIEAFKAKSAARQAVIQKDFADFLEELIARRDEPVLISGMMAMLYRVVEAAKAKGLPDGCFHPDTVITVGGGKKGQALPPDFIEQCERFFNLTPYNFNDGYGMGEMSGFCPDLPVGKGWAMPPWMIPLIIEKSGETLLNPSDGRGMVEGRFAFLDLLVDGRWGGLVTGDRLVVDFSPAEDGIAVPVVRDLVRYKDLPEGDDKATCAGTIDAYVRGALEEAV
jgi:hypothetical protein